MRIKTGTNKENAAVVVAIIILLLCELFFFRNVLFSDMMFGDDGDGRLTMLYTEHWYHFFKGEASFADLGIFYPTENTLAFSDMFLGFGIIHSVLRFAGLDVFLAFKTSLILVHITGTLVLFIMLERYFSVHVLWALFSAIAFSFSTTYANCMNHPQLFAISMVPIALLFAVLFFGNLKNRKRRSFFATLTILQLVLILYTAWYVAFFTALFVATTVVIVLLVFLFNRQPVVAPIKEFIVTIKYDLIIYAVFFIVLLFPFAVLELSVASNTGTYAYQSLGSLPEAIDFINVTDKNWMISPLMRKMALESRGLSAENNEGFSIVLLGFFSISLLLMNLKLRENPIKRRLLLFLAISISIVFNMLLIVRLSSNKISLWYFVYHLFPGAKAIRAVARYMLYLSLPMSIVTALSCNELFSAKAKRNHRYVVLFAIITLFMSNVTIGGVNSSWNKTESLQWLNGISPPPEECNVFFIIDSVNQKPQPFKQLDAYQIADRFGIKTINGYSGVTPQEWREIWNIDEENYKDAIALWIANNQLENVYAYSARQNVWIKADLSNMSNTLLEGTATTNNNE